jgi:pimeloyl-ACP methyl ester carboxylesterase
LSSRPFQGDYDTNSAELSSGTLYFHDEGVLGSSAVVLLHGRNSHSGTWRKNASHLAKETGWRVIAPSLSPWRGSAEELEISGYVNVVDELLSKLKIENSVLVGNSMGGWIAMRLALIRKSVQALVLEDSAGIDKPSDPETLHALDKLGIPVLILWGREDQVLPVDAGERINSEIKKSELVVFDKVGHVPHWEKPEEFNKLVLDFVKINAKRILHN